MDGRDGQDFHSHPNLHSSKGKELCYRIERGFEQVDRGEYVTIEIDKEGKTYRVVE